MNARLTTTILTLLLVLTFGLRAEFAQIDSARLTFDDEYPEFAREAVTAVLARREYEFLGGAELNGMTSLRYRGGTGALNRFLAELARCLDVTMTISFTSDLDEHTDWRVFHEPHANRFQIEIAHQSKRVDLERLVVPEIGTRALEVQ